MFSVASTLAVTLGSREPGEMDAELLRWAYELCLQPVDRFDGFEWGDQLHGGTVSVTRGTSGGARFEIRLPIG